MKLGIGSTNVIKPVTDVLLHHFAFLVDYLNKFAGFFITHARRADLSNRVAHHIKALYDM